LNLRPPDCFFGVFSLQGPFLKRAQSLFLSRVSFLKRAQSRFLSRVSFLKRAFRSPMLYPG